MTTVTTQPGTTVTTVPEDLVASSAEAAEATIQIVAQGTFVEPGEGALETAGAGSGFIVDPSGIAVTNNHVVTGAGLLEVYVAEDDQPVNARVLGVSECSDLAVIDLEGDGYPYFAWYEGEINPGLDVYAAGFPLGDPAFTLTRGIVSKSDHVGESEWASVDAILEHDARIRPGNSGGPLITEEGAVVGVNYAGRADTDQNFAISVTEARPIVESLSAGTDIDSLGINGVAFDDGAGNTGVWVASVESGSPADDAGIAAGDIVTRLEGITLGVDATVADYCDVIRSHAPDDVLAVEVVRTDTGEVLEGQINGSALVPAFSFEDELGEEGQGASYPEYTTVTDDTGALSVEIPTEWADVDGAPYEDEAGNQIADVRASTDLGAFNEAWDVPGMIFSASSDWTASFSDEALLDQIKASFEETCSYDGRAPYEDVAYTGFFDTYSDCGGTTTDYVVVAASPEDGSFRIVVHTQVVGDRDLEALDRILGSFVVIGEV